MPADVVGNLPRDRVPHYQNNEVRCKKRGLKCVSLMLGPADIARHAYEDVIQRKQSCNEGSQCVGCCDGHNEFIPAGARPCCRRSR